MKTYIFIRKFYVRGSNNYYRLMDSVILGVYANKDKAIEAADMDIEKAHKRYGGVETVKSCFVNEVYNHTLEMGDSKSTFIVLEKNIL